jgi:hypothetical protein
MGYGPTVTAEHARADREIGLDELLESLPAGGPEGEPADEFRVADPPDVFVPPTLRVIDRSASPTVTLLSARGATGKSVLAQYISHEKNAPLWNLAEDLSVSAHAFEAKLSGYLGPGRASEFKGSPDAFVVIDALDEARFRVSANSWTEFINSLTSFSESDHHFVMLGRERILEDVWLQLDEAGISCNWFEISHFDGEQRVRYVDARVARKRDTETDAYRGARDAVLEALAGTVDSASSDAFVGYAPVLDAVVALLQDGNLMAVENTFRDPELRGERLEVLVQVLDRLLLREQEKIEPMSADLGIDASSAYGPSEQVEWLSAELFGAESPTLEWCPEERRGDYASQLAEFIRDHPFRAETRWASPVFSAYVAARQFGDPLLRDHLIDVGRATELLFAFASAFDATLTLDEWQFAALHASLLAAEWQAIEAHVSIDNADTGGDFDEAFGELVLLEAGVAQRRTPFELIVDKTGLLRLLGPMTALSVDIPGDVEVQPPSASLELGPDCYVRCRNMRLGGETIQIVRRATPTNGGGTVEDEASVVLEVGGEFRCDGSLPGNPPTATFELRVPDGVRLAYPWVAYRAPFPERTEDPNERAVRFLNMFMNLVRNHGHRGDMAVFNKKLEGRQSVKGEELGRALAAMEDLGVVRRSGEMIFLNSEWEQHRFSGKGVQGLPALADKIEVWRPVLDAIGQSLA